MYYASSFASLFNRLDNCHISQHCAIPCRIKIFIYAKRAKTKLQAIKLIDRTNMIYDCYFIGCFQIMCRCCLKSCRLRNCFIVLEDCTVAQKAGKINKVSCCE